MAFARGPPGAQKPARNVRIPKLKIFREITFLNSQGGVVVPREGLFFKENPYGFCQRTSRSAKTRQKCSHPKLKIFREVTFSRKIPKGGKCSHPQAGPQGGAVFQGKSTTAFARGPPGAQKPARNVRIPKLKIFRGISFLNSQGGVVVPREGLFFKENPYGFCQRTSRSAKTRQKCSHLQA